MGDNRLTTPNCHRTNRVDKKNIVRDYLDFLKKPKYRSRMVSPSGNSKRSPISSRSPKIRCSVEPNIFRDPNHEYANKFTKFIKNALNNISSRRESPIEEKLKSKTPVEIKITTKPGHRRNKSEVPSSDQNNFINPYSIKGKQNDKISPKNTSQDCVSDKFFNDSQEKTLKNGFIRNDLPNSNASLGSSFERVEISKLEAEEKERENLIQTIFTNFRRKGLPPATSVDFYQLGIQIGKGAFGKVYSGIHKLTGLKVAIKIFDKSHIKDERIRRKVFQEVFVMKRVKHRNVIRLLEVFESKRHLMIVMEYSGGGDLLQFVKSKGRLTETEAKKIFSQVIDAVKACHQKNVIHRDVKLDNILLSADLTLAKLCDFGVSRIVKPSEKINEQCGTPAYLPPEIIADHEYEPFYVDLWSMGVLLYAMLCGTVPFKAKTMQDLHKLILRCKYTMPAHVSLEAQDLIAKMLNPIPHLRISLEEMKNHQWFAIQESDDWYENHSLPRFSGTSAHPHKVDENKIYKKLLDFGFPQEYVIQSMKFNDINHATATYQLLELNQM
ncbi:unnamed protein product [Blepharisma stoltei]|uniref:Protein kinase domain-containing protein n=1 Tax=Blepharisma stoltei TaxID=1481888 RepID=A0AAU9JDF2_9CILI|nr:unnamed protein product [Blepharisma stoltei]